MGAGEGAGERLKAEVRHLRPELVTSATLLREISEALVRDNADDAHCIVVVIRGGTVQHWMKATPEQCALAGVTLSSFAVAASSPRLPPPKSS